MLADVLVPGDNDDFFSFEEYTSDVESTSTLLNSVYHKLLSVPLQQVPLTNKLVIEALGQAGFQGWNNARALQVGWVLQLYHDELIEKFGGCRLVDERQLPLGMLAMMRRKAVQWNMVL
jgi:hypothetical protein